MYKPSVIESFENFLSIKNDWENLRLENGYSLFSSFDWYWCWLKAAQNKIRPFIIVMTNERTGRIEGILPLQRDRKRFLNGLTSLVHGDTQCFEFIAEKKNEDQLLASLYHFFRQLKNIAYIEFVPVSANHRPLMKLSTSYRCFLIIDDKKSPFFSCVQPFDDVIKNKSKKSRQRIRNHLNRFSNFGNVIVDRLSVIEPSDFEDVLAISGGSWKYQAGCAIGSKETTKTFFRLLSERAQRNEWLQVWFLSVNDQRVAMEFHLRERGTVYALRGDYLSQCEKYSPGRYLDYHIIQRLCDDQQVNLYDMCGDLYDYKTKWTKDIQQFYRLLWIRSPFIRMVHAIKNHRKQKRNGSSGFHSLKTNNKRKMYDFKCNKNTVQGFAQFILFILFPAVRYRFVSDISVHKPL